MKPYQVVPFSKEKLRRLELKASNHTTEELKEMIEDNKAESLWCLETNILLKSIIEKRS